MRYTKRCIEMMDHCYAVQEMSVNGEPFIFFAAENKGPCFGIDCATLSQRIDVWRTPGGTMSMVAIPDKPGEFLAIQKFYRLYEWEEACLVWVKPNAEGGYDVKELFTLPYLHRFDLLQCDGKTWLIACTLASHKKTREDWTCPGSIYTAPFPDDWNVPICLSELRTNCFQNHGYAHLKRNGHDAGLITCEQGVFEVTPPFAGSSEWRVEQIMAMPSSDADMIDIDGDGEAEIATIEPFHGRYFRIYKKINGRYEMVFEHPEVTDFYHVVKAGVLMGEPCFVGGCRRGKQQLFTIHWNQENKAFIVDTIDSDVGPSNALIYNSPKGDAIFAANREAAQAAVYFVEA